MLSWVSSLCLCITYMYVSQNNIKTKYLNLKLTKMTEQEEKEFEAEWRSFKKLLARVIGMQLVFGLLAVALCWILI